MQQRALIAAGTRSHLICEPWLACAPAVAPIDLIEAASGEEGCRQQTTVTPKQQWTPAAGGRRPPCADARHSVIVTLRPAGPWPLGGSPQPPWLASMQRSAQGQSSMLHMNDAADGTGMAQLPWAGARMRGRARPPPSHGRRRAPTAAQAVAPPPPPPPRGVFLRCRQADARLCPALSPAPKQSTKRGSRSCTTPMDRSTSPTMIM